MSDSASFSLKGGDVITVLGPSSAQTLRGPGNFEAKQVALASAAGKRGRFGALRTAEIARNPSIWDLDVTQSGKVCVNNNNISLWRPDSQAAVTVSIRSADGKSQEVAWAAGKSSAAWPKALPIANSAQYQIAWPDSGDTSSIEFVTVSSAPTDLVGAAQLLIENGCQNQLNLLVESASKSK